MSNFKLALVGDVMLGRLVNDHLKSASLEYPWGDTLPIFKQADLRICNLECAVSDRGEPWSITPKVFHFRTDAKNIDVLKAANINLVSLANNHTLDFGYEAMADTLEILDEAKILYAGAGQNQKQARQAAVYKQRDFRLSFIAFSDNEPDWQASADKPGILYVPIDFRDERAKNLFKLVQQTKKEVDCLIVSAHWGGNWGYVPPPEHQVFARALIDLGVDIIFGHSAHVFRGIDIYHGRPIIYSAGDFIDDYAVDEIERNDESFIFLLEFQNQPTGQTRRFGVTKRLRLYPTMIDNFQARLAGERSRTIASKMQKLCADLGTKATWNKPENYLEISIKSSH